MQEKRWTTDEFRQTWRTPFPNFFDRVKNVAKRLRRNQVYTRSHPVQAVNAVNYAPATPVVESAAVQSWMGPPKLSFLARQINRLASGAGKCGITVVPRFGPTRWTPTILYDVCQPIHLSRRALHQDAYWRGWSQLIPELPTSSICNPIIWSTATNMMTNVLQCALGKLPSLCRSRCSRKYSIQPTGPPCSN